MKTQKQALACDSVYQSCCIWTQCFVSQVYDTKNNDLGEGVVSVSACVPHWSVQSVLAIERQWGIEFIYFSLLKLLWIT